MQSNQGSGAQSPVSLAILRSRETGEEFCNVCGEGMKFPLGTHIDDPVRRKNGAYYTEGAGQTCAACATPQAEQ